MNRDILKMHVFYLTFITIITGIVLFLVNGSTTVLLMGLEKLRMGDVFYFSGAVFFSFIWGFCAFTIGYWLLCQLSKAYLDSRTLKVPELCPECKADFDIYDVKWIE